MIIISSCVAQYHRYITYQGCRDIDCEHEERLNFEHDHVCFCLDLSLSTDNNVQRRLVVSLGMIASSALSLYKSASKYMLYTSIIYLVYMFIHYDLEDWTISAGALPLPLPPLLEAPEECSLGLPPPPRPRPPAAVEPEPLPAPPLPRLFFPPFP